MSKICGIINPNYKDDMIKPILSKMTRSMKHEDWHRIDEWCQNAVGLGHISIGAVNEEIQPIQSFDGKKVIISAGKIVAYEDRKRELIDKGYVFRYPNNDAEFVLHLYEAYGTEKFKELNGIFAFCVWDKEKKELVLVNDRYGMRQVYYYFNESNNMFLFATEIKAISKQDFFDKKVNWEAWNVFIRLGFNIGQNTFFKKVCVLPQGSVLHFNLKNITLENYWNYNLLKIRDTFDDREYVDNLVFLFKQSIKRRIIPGKKAAVLLSGGLDSRGIAAELKYQNLPFATYTTRKFSAIDTDKKLASLVANRLGIKNEFFDLPDDFLEAYESNKNYLLDYESDEHAWLLPLLKKIPLDVKVNYDGIAQDLMCDPYLYLNENLRYLQVFESKEYEKFIYEWIYQKMYAYLHWPIDNNKHNFIFFSKQIRSKFSSEAFIAAVRQELLRYEGSPNNYFFFRLDTRTRREIALSPFQLLLNKFESFCPYLDNDYFDYLMSLPVLVKRNGVLRKKFLDRAYPELSEINMDYVTKEQNEKYSESHMEIYFQQLKYLLKIGKSFLNTNKLKIFNMVYLFPRIFYDYLLVKIAKEKLYHRSHFWLIQPLYFLNSWLLSEKITKKNI